MYSLSHSCPVVGRLYKLFFSSRPSLRPPITKNRTPTSVTKHCEGTIHINLHYCTASPILVQLLGGFTSFFSAAAPLYGRQLQIRLTEHQQVRQNTMRELF